MNLIGLDVGFSKTRKSSGVAKFCDETPIVGCATSSWESRKAILGSCTSFHVAAIDAPVLPEMGSDRRDCERIFTLGRFQRRCKPGLSHVPGTGHELRNAGEEACKQLCQLKSMGELLPGSLRLKQGLNVVEAFPNAFLALSLPTDVFENVPYLRRGKKFDWLYEQSIETDRISKVADIIGLQHIHKVTEKIKLCTNHDQRAALICLFTAAGVAAGKFTAVGSKPGGYFFLPPWEAWDSWAQNELKLHRHRMDHLEVWIDAEQLDLSMPLP